jgi:hypothetical protein
MQAVLFAAALIAPAVAYQSFQSNIPNGANVPGAPGVGHVSTGGGGARNTFGKRALYSGAMRAPGRGTGLHAGQKFAAEGNRWTSALCQADSDGDGATNGQAYGPARRCGRCSDVSITRCVAGTGRSVLHVEAGHDSDAHDSGAGFRLVHLRLQLRANGLATYAGCGVRSLLVTSIA